MKKSILIGILFAFITSVPYIYGYLVKPENSYFLARSVVNAADTYTHVANIISAKEGNIILPNLYSFEDKTPFIFRPTYLILGLASRYFGIEPILSLHLGRIVGVILFVLILFSFLEFYFPDEKRRIISSLIILVSSGIGSIIYGNFPSSIDLWVPEANTFFMMLESPHFVFSQIFLLLSIIYLLQYLQKYDYNSLFLSSLFATLIMIEHPYMVPFVLTFNTIIFIFYLRLSALTKFMILPIISLGVIYKLYFLTPSAKLTLNQTVLPTPSIENVLYGFGLITPLALFGIYKENLKKTENFILIGWIIITAILIYSPFATQRRFLEGVHISIALFASIGFFYIYDKAHQKLLRLILIALILVLLPITNVFNVGRMIQAYSEGNLDRYIHYLPQSDVAAMKWLEKNSNPGEIILTNFYYSNILPGFTGRFVYNGHLYLSVNSREKMRKVDEFITSYDMNSRHKFLRDNGINYLYFGKNDPYNRYLSDFGKYSFLQVIYEEDGVTIFRVLII